MFIIKDYECENVNCGEITEFFVDPFNVDDFLVCPLCDSSSKKIITMRETNTVDPSWLQKVLVSVDKDSNKSHINEFLKHPTRANMNTYLAKENLRHGDKGEPAFRKVDHRAKEQEKQRHQGRMLQRQMERNSVRVGGL